MAINVIVQYNGWFLPDILLLTQPLLYGSMALLSSYIITTLLTMYLTVLCLVALHGEYHVVAFFVLKPICNSILLLPPCLMMY